MEEEAAPDAAAEAKAEVGTEVKAEAGMEPKAEVEGGVDGAAQETDEVGSYGHHACTHLQLPCLWLLGIYIASKTSHVIDKHHVATS